jgi:hypothetical protein
MVAMDRHRCLIRVRRARPLAPDDTRMLRRIVLLRSRTRHGERAATMCKCGRALYTLMPPRYSQSPHGVFTSNGGRSSSRVVRNIRHRRATGGSALPPTAALPPLKRMPPAESPSAWLAMQHIKSVQQRLGSDLNVGDGMCVCAGSHMRVQFRAVQAMHRLAAARARRSYPPSLATMHDVHRARAQQ